MSDVQWITINGVHVPLGADGEPSDPKWKQIYRNKKQADALNKSKSGDNKSNKANEYTQEIHEKQLKELAKSKYEDGTYDLNTMKQVSYSKGYQVTFCQIGDKYSAKEYADKVNECLKFSSDGKTLAGKFESTPEISFHCNSKEQAIAYAKANNQISIWDWEAGDTIDTGGTGRRN